MISVPSVLNGNCYNLVVTAVKSSSLLSVLAPTQAMIQPFLGSRDTAWTAASTSANITWSSRTHASKTTPSSSVRSRRPAGILRSKESPTSLLSVRINKPFPLSKQCAIPNFSESIGLNTLKLIVFVKSLSAITNG